MRTISASVICPTLRLSMPTLERLLRDYPSDYCTTIVRLSPVRPLWRIGAFSCLGGSWVLPRVRQLSTMGRIPGRLPGALWRFFMSWEYRYTTIGFYRRCEPLRAFKRYGSIVSSLHYIHPRAKVKTPGEYPGAFSYLLFT